MHSCVQPTPIASYTTFPRHSFISLPQDTRSQPGSPGPAHRPVTLQTAVQIPYRTASAANTSGFLLVSSSKTPRIESQPFAKSLPEAFPIKASDHTGVEQLDQHCAVSKDLPLRLAGCFRHSGQYEVAEQVRSWGHYRCGAGQPWSPTPGVRPMTSVGC